MELIAIGFIVVLVIGIAKALGPRDVNPDYNPQTAHLRDMVAPTTSSGAYEYGLAGCPAGVCTPSRNTITGEWTINGHIATAEELEAAHFEYNGNRLVREFWQVRGGADEWTPPGQGRAQPEQEREPVRVRR